MASDTSASPGSTNEVEPAPTSPASITLPESAVQKPARKKKKNKNKKKKNVTTRAEVEPFPQFNEFPEKVQRHIFECAFYTEDVSGPVLALVSRKVNDWIEPLIYNYIIIDRFHRISPRPDRLWRTFSEGTKLQEFYEEHVKGILVNGNVDPVVTDLLAVCTNIVAFACYAQGPLPETILEKLASIFSTQEFPNLRRLSLSGLGLDADDIQRPFFQNLTHLTVDVGDNHEAFPWQELKSHPCLTHILIDMQFELHKDAPEEFKSIVLSILSYAPPTLHCLVVLVDWDKLYEISLEQICDCNVFSDAINGKLDERVVVAGYTGDQEEINVAVENLAHFMQYMSCIALTPEYAVPWACPPDGVHRDVWERAEEVIRYRRVNGRGVTEPEIGRG